MFFKKRKTKTYTTSDWDTNPNGPPADPIVALRRLPKGPLYFLQDYRDKSRYRKWLFVGNDPDLCDIVLDEPELEDPTVNDRHCSILFTPDKRVFCRHSGGKNRTKVNRTRLHKGTMELSPDDVLGLGAVKLVALNSAGLAEIDHQPKTTATTPKDYFRRAMAAHADDSKAARALRTSRSTLLYWLTRGRYAK